MSRTQLDRWLFKRAAWITASVVDRPSARHITLGQRWPSSWSNYTGREGYYSQILVYPLLTAHIETYLPYDYTIVKITLPCYCHQDVWHTGQTDGFTIHKVQRKHDVSWFPIRYSDSYCPHLGPARENFQEKVQRKLGLTDIPDGPGMIRGLPSRTNKGYNVVTKLRNIPAYKLSVN